MASQIPSEPAPCVAVISGATAGAEVACRLAERGAVVVVIEQNSRPFGKIEDGLPRWHHALRRKEYDNIRDKLSRPGVHFVPMTRVGRDLGFAELAREWGFSAVVLANGAWSDRPLPLEGADAFVGKGLIYQNPFIIWFNHANEAAYEGERFVPLDGTMVVGGGLASIDVAKVLMLETTRQAARERGVELPMFELEVKGIPKSLAAHGLSFEDLGLEGCTIFYRRDVEDMPLSEPPPGATPERIEKVRKGRRRILEKAMEKFRFKMEPLCMPDGLLTENDRLVGLRFRRTKIENGRVVPQDERFEARGSCVISSIGSIPEPIAGIPMKGELFEFSDWDLGRLSDYPSVFSVGNVVTGKGNIVASRKHAAHVTEDAIERFLGLDESGHEGEEALLEGAREQARQAAERIHAQLAPHPPASPDTIARILERVKERQREIGYTGDLDTWLARVTPPDME